MELQAQSYYNAAKFTNISYFLQLFLKTYLGNILFRGNSSRVLFASDEFCYRRRLDSLAEKGISSDLYLDLPFMNFWRSGNWVPSDRPTQLQAGPAVVGVTAGYSTMKFLNMKAPFHCTAHFSRDDDAQLAYETLMWLQLPSEKQYVLPGVVHNNTEISIPVSIKTSSVEFNPSFTEQDWLQSNRIIPISFDIDLYSVMLQPLAQGPESPLFSEHAQTIYITKRVLLDFLAYTQDPLIDEEHIELEVIQEFDPATETEVTLSSGTSTATTITVAWDYEDEDVLEDMVRLFIRPDEYVEVSVNDKAYTFTGLQSGSQYTIAAWFFFTSGKVAKRELTIQTTSTDTSSPKLKPIIGYTF